MQQPPPMMPAVPSFPPANITTEQIQKYLDDNKKLILAILDNQNLGKLAECAQYQAQLQKNLMYLAAIADAQPQIAQPQMPSMPAQMSPHPAMQQGGYFMQHPQAALMAQQPGMFSPRMPVPVSSPHQAHEQQQQRQLHPQHHQAVQAPTHIRPGGPTNGMPSKQAEASAGAAGSGGPANVGDSRGVQKQESSEAGPAGGDGQQRSLSPGQGVGDREQSQRTGGDAAQ